MRIQQFLEHHGMTRNPFAEEDAQTDLVFTEHCIESVFHPTWDKIYGDPQAPSTSLVFGEKGAGKTAIRLQIARHLRQYNRAHPQQQLFVVHYDDFNPFLDRFRERLGARKGRRADRVLRAWRLSDHMDAILSLAVTGLVDRILNLTQPAAFVDATIDPAAVDRLDRHQARDALLLAVCYDQSVSTTFHERWRTLRRRLRFEIWRARVPLGIGIAATAVLAATMLGWAFAGHGDWVRSLWLLFAAALLGAWWPWLVRWWNVYTKSWRVLRQMRLSTRDRRTLRTVLMQFTRAEIAAQPLPDADGTDQRYEMLLKLQGVLQTLGFHGIVVLVDRLDEPHLINGSAELMKGLLWPMLDNKLLKHPGLGLKIMAPIELTRFIEREDRDFYQRARLDKQNMVSAFEWTGEALYDVANARLMACRTDGTAPRLRDLIDPAISDQRLLDVLRGLRTPRHLFKFLYRLLVNHCNQHVEGEPVWRVMPATFESTLALYRRDQDAFDQGVGAG